MWNIFRKKQVKPAPIIINEFDDEYLKEFVYRWNRDFPIDKWYRNKHKVAFNSPIHREVSFFDMRFEYEEEQLFDRRDIDYKIDTGDWLKLDKSIMEDDTLTEEQKIHKFKKEFENLDLDRYDD